MATNTTSSLSALMQRYYDKNFVLRQRDVLVYDQFGQVRPLPSGEGNTVYFTRYSPLTRATTPLTEGSAGTSVAVSAANITASVAEYGNWTQSSKFLATTAIDQNLKEIVGIMGQNAAETIDRLIREELVSGATIQYAAARSALANVTASDVLTAAEIRKAVRTLKKNLALRFPNGFFAGIVGPDTSFDLMGDNVWINAKTYSDVQDLYKGELGELNGARIVETTDQKSEASTTTVYSNFFMGREAYGLTQLMGDQQKVYVKTPGPNSTDNPLERFSTIGWAQTFVPKTLVGSWIVNVKSAATP